MTAALLLFAMVVLILVNGFFVAAEFGLVRSSRSKLQDLADDGSAPARRALALHDDMNQYLSSCQVGITLASLGIGFLGEPAIATLFEPLLGGPLSHGASVAVSVAIAYVLVTSIHVIAGEQVPKIFAIVNAERVARSAARPLGWFELGMRPFINLLNGAANGILRLMRIDPTAELDEGGSPEDFKLLDRRASHKGQAPPSVQAIPADQPVLLRVKRGSDGAVLKIRLQLMDTTAKAQEEIGAEHK